MTDYNKINFFYDSGLTGVPSFYPTELRFKLTETKSITKIRLVNVVIDPA